MARVVVTGGAGFIGSHVVNLLVEKGHRVVVIDDLSTGLLENLYGTKGEVEFHRLDILDLEAVRSLMRRADYVIHEAARNRVQCSIDDPIGVNETNVRGTLNVLVAARDCGVSKVVFASSSSVYGDNPVTPKVETLPAAPKSPYAVSKLAGENYCLAFMEVYGLPVVSLRYFSVFGRRQRADMPYAAVIPKFINLMRQGRPITIYGTGLQARDFTCVKDVAKATVMFLDNNATGVFNVGKGSSSSVDSLVTHLEDLMGMEAECNYAPLPKGDWQDSLADISKIRGIGYAPSYDLRTGLQWTLGIGA